jgi:Ran GTPase-activating protein (RanGAP) involved in mRNA processing and transport
MLERVTMDRYLVILERLENYQMPTEVNILAQEYTEEKLIILDQCPHELLPHFFNIAHSVVSYELALNQPSSDQVIHPVYGALIRFFFQSHRRLSPHHEIVFFYKAGKIYLKQQKFNLAITCFHHAYKRCHLHALSHRLENKLKKKLNQLEVLIYHHFFLQLELNSSSTTEPLKSKLDRCLMIADRLTKENLRKELNSCYQLPIFIPYLESIDIALKRLVNEQENRRHFQELIETLFWLAERINVHVTVDGTLKELLSHCYQLMYNILRDQALNMPELMQRLSDHENGLFESRKRTAELQATLLSTLMPTWPTFLQKLMAEAATFNSLVDEAFSKQLIKYTSTIKEATHTLCQQLRLVLGEPPCHFAVIGFGSISREEILPHSDLDICVLIDAGHLGRETRSQLRAHHYFTYFIQALNQLLKLGYGQWQCIAINRDKESAPSYLRQETLYEMIDTGLRIDSMDIEEMNAIINLPAPMAAWVIEHCASSNEKLNDKHRTIAYGLLTPTAIYSSNEVPDHNGNTHHPILTAYLDALQANLNEFSQPMHPSVPNSITLPLFNKLSYFLKQSKHEMNWLLTLWQQRDKWSVDKAYLFIKRSLWVLDLWTMLESLRVNQCYVPEVLVTTTQRLTALLQYNKSGHYFIQSVRRCRQLFLMIKHKINDDAKLLTFINDEQFQSCFIHTVLPVAYLLKHVQLFTQDNNTDPHADLLAAVFTNKDKDNTLLVETVKSLSTQTMGWLHANGAKLEDYKRLYKVILKSQDETDIQEFIHYFNQTYGFYSPITQTLARIPNEIGYRQLERLTYERLFADLLAITQDHSQAAAAEKAVLTVNLEWFDAQGECHQRFLSPVIANAILDKDLNIKKYYKNSFHRVSPIRFEEHSLHIKQLPTQPLSDYAIDIFTRRITGRGTVANTLARLTVTAGKRNCYYPVLISGTAQGETLRDQLKDNPNLNIENASYTALILVALLTFPGDATSRNFIVGKDKELTFIDLDQHFVEPIVKKLSLSGLNKVQFCHILFCLNQANQPLDKTTLEEFVTLERIPSLINRWVEDVLIMQGRYLQLFTETQRKRLYLLNKNYQFTPLLLLREGVLAGLLFNLNYLQIHLQNALMHPPLPCALDLLARLDSRLGHYYQHYFKIQSNPEKRLIAITDSSQYSVPSSIVLQASLGSIPSFEEIENGERYTLTSAKKELLAMSDFKPDFSKIIDRSGQPDIARQQAILKVLSVYPQTDLDLSHCIALNDDTLKMVLSKSHSLRSLNLRSCPQLTDATVIYLANQHTLLDKLYLSNNSGFRKIADFSFLFERPLIFNNLIELHISRCPELTVLNIHGPRLKKVNSEECLKLKTKKNLEYLDKTPVMPSNELRQTSEEVNNANLHKIILTAVYHEHLTVLQTIFSSEFPPITTVIGIDFCNVHVNDLGENPHTLQIWAVSEQEPFRSIRLARSRGSQFIIGVFSIARSDFFGGYESKVVNPIVKSYLQDEFGKPVVLLVSDQLPKQLVTNFSLDLIRKFKETWHSDFLHIIDADDLDFESAWVKQWLLAIILHEEYPEWLTKLQAELGARFAQQYLHAMEMAKEFMQIEFTQLHAIQALQPLNFVQLDRFYSLIIQEQPDPNSWSQPAYRQNAKRVLFLALTRQNLSVALRMQHLIIHGELITYNQTMSVDKNIWRTMTDEFCFALENQINDIKCDFTNHFFNDEDLEKLATSISCNSSLAQLDLSHNEFTSTGVNKLCFGLCQNRSLTSLNLSGNQLDNVCADALAFLLQQATAIQYLSLSDNHFTDDAANVFSQAFLKNKSLLTVDFSKNKFTYVGIVQLLNAMASSSLTQLDLSANDIGSITNMQNLVASETKFSHQLSTLNIASCKITDNALYKLIESINPNNQIQEINIADNDLSENAFPLLCKLMTRCPQLKILNIRGLKTDKSYFHARFLKMLGWSKITDLNYDEPDLGTFKNEISKILKINQVRSKINLSILGNHFPEKNPSLFLRKSLLREETLSQNEILHGLALINAEALTQSYQETLFYYEYCFSQIRKTPKLLESYYKNAIFLEAKATYRTIIDAIKFGDLISTDRLGIDINTMTILYKSYTKSGTLRFMALYPNQALFLAIAMLSPGFLTASIFGDGWGYFDSERKTALPFAAAIHYNYMITNFLFPQIERVTNGWAEKEFHLISQALVANDTIINFSGKFIFFNPKRNQNFLELVKEYQSDHSESMDAIRLVVERQATEHQDWMAKERPVVNAATAAQLITSPNRILRSLAAYYYADQANESDENMVHLYLFAIRPYLTSNWQALVDKAAATLSCKFDTIAELSSLSSGIMQKLDVEKLETIFTGSSNKFVFVVELILLCLPFIGGQPRKLLSCTLISTLADIFVITLDLEPAKSAEICNQVRTVLLHKQLPQTPVSDEELQREARPGPR